MENILEIFGVGENILAGIIAVMGDIKRSDDAKEIQKYTMLKTGTRCDPENNLHKDQPDLVMVSRPLINLVHDIFITTGPVLEVQKMVKSPQNLILGIDRKGRKTRMFGKIKESIDKGIVSVSVKSSTYLEIEKLKTKVGNINSKIDMTVSEMGAAVYSQWKDGSVNKEYIENVCRNMMGMEEEIAGYQEQVRRLEQEKASILGGAGQGVAESAAAGAICGCGCVNQAGARFCVDCGQPLDVSKESQELQGEVCQFCGAKAEAGAKFCVGCGKIMGE